MNNHFTVTNEPQVLSVTNVATLSNADVLVSSIVVQDSAGVVTYTNGVDYVAATDSNWMTTLLLTTNSAIAEGSTNLVSYIFATPLIAEALTLTVTGDVTVAQGGMINTDGKGYAGGTGPGAGQSAGNPLSGSGAGHGGYGGQSAALGGVGMAYTEINDSIWQPVSLGSGGGGGYNGVGGAGGGSVKLVVGGNLRVDGTVSANGLNGINSRSGGGSGGSIWLTCQNLSGAGVISVNGGAGEPSSGGGGGAGRISLNYEASTFTGLTPARGGSGYIRGGAGTVYTHADSQFAGQVLVDNGGNSGMSTPFGEQEAYNLTAQGGAIISLWGSQTFGNLLVASNAWICLSNQTATITVWSNATIQAGGGIIADSAGYAVGLGTGVGRYDTSAHTGGGGGYGGYGAAGGGAAAYGGSTYGSVTAPVDFGSGGGSYYGLPGAGGGAIRLNVTGMLLLDGRISANGSPALGVGGGGGSGGSVWVTAGTLTGAGTISANGGMGNGFGLTGGGGGGGGRIAIQYGMNLFFGITSSQGGSGSAWGGAGTIYTLANNQSYGQVLVDNGGQAGTNTTLGSVSLGTIDLTVKNGAVLTPPYSQTIGTLLVASNGWVSIASQLLTVTGNATIQAGGGIIADSTGSAGGGGTGAGKYVSTSSGYFGGGGGYGGYGAAGGAPSTYSAYGGSTYGSVTAPTAPGSGGGTYSTLAIGGAGGGAISLSVTGVLQVDGRISAAGGPATTPNAGGGSGGGISLTAGTLSGSGVISANGGAGNYLGGGGGGGRIALFYGVYDFSGAVSAYGGGGYAVGGAGTIYTKANGQNWGLVTVDNGGQAGTNTSWTSMGTVDLTVKGGAMVTFPSYSPTIGTLLVASNGWIIVSSQLLTVTGNGTIQAGGGILADGTGYGASNGAGGASGSGPGAGGSYGGGAGHGGYGASVGGFAYASGGNTYGSVEAPTELGSAGGGEVLAGPPRTGGGAGGGAVRLSVAGTLQVDGRISAQGLSGTGSESTGGGSGGSIYLTVGTLSGAGIMAANGGAGNGFGGGGGGGRIAVTYTGANTFSGLMSAYGAGGYATGGAGTIYTAGYNQMGQVVVDNGGLAGTNTSWPSAGTVGLTVKGGAVLSVSGGQTIGSLLVASNGWVSAVTLSGYGPTLNVTGNATIQAGGGIIADGAGSAAGQGSGAGGYASTQTGYVGGGGGYGGYGAASGGSPAARGGSSWGTVTDGGVGSGGGNYSTSYAGGPGGGGVFLNVTGTLEVDGRISAAGGPAVGANMGGGSGGGISLTVGTLAGAGVIAANGGAGDGLGGGGGGGRIAVTYTANAFSGLMSAYGGGGYATGGAGTIYTKANNQSWGQVVVDNGGLAGTNTSWTSAGTMDLTVKGGAVVSPPLSSQTFGNLLVASNGWMSLSTQNLTVTSNATVQAGGGIVADGTGYAGGQGIGAGRFVSTTSGYVGGGGGYGGFGAASGGTTPAYGGSTYGSATAPVNQGSGGGSYSSSGGAGGGIVRLNVTGALLVNGRISANGGGGIAQGAGGGSGGSVWLTVGTLAGAGVIAANGGAGNELGGGGGGGCIALQYGVNAFEGSASAYGGGGYAWGGAGTIYTKANSQAMGQIVVDNGGNSGTNTPLAYLSPFDLTIRGGAVAYPSAPYLLLSNLFITSGGALISLSTQTNLDVTVLRNATIDTGGVMAVDGKGFGLGVGPGVGVSNNSIGSGGGYGGNGGASSLSSGGAIYGSAQQPVDRGSGGGQGWQGTIGGGEGGGAIRLTVGGTLTVNGRVSAAGDAALQDDGGGGSGGSIWLTAGAFTGNGAIAADGGAGQLYDGGGGGGGRVAMYAPVNVFAGVVSAAGGPGYSSGQNGSIYSAATPPAPQVVSTSPSSALLVNAAVSSFNIQFSTVVNPASVSAATVALAAPSGAAVSNLVVSAVSPYVFQVSFPQQIASGSYVITVGPQVLDLYGQPMSQVYTGGFMIVWSLVQGVVTDTNGLPVAGVVLQPDSGIPSTTTDSNGLYGLNLPPVGTVHVTPSAPGLMFVPSSRTYVNVTGAVTNENYVAVSTIAPTVAMQVQTNTCVFNWYGISGVNYQPLYSTNLVNWLPYNGPVPGTNGPMQLLMPMGANPIMFFRVGASD